MLCPRRLGKDSNDIPFTPKLPNSPTVIRERASKKTLLQASDSPLEVIQRYSGLEGPEYRAQRS